MGLEKSISLITGNNDNNKREKGYAYFGLANYYLKSGNKAKALENAEKANELVKTDSTIVDFIKQLKK